ncbi:helix-turn-helix transcriptional regulator [Leptotrichia shahii]|uniref:helix-turn-helix domain-containing protein n=1 Tax=Leptotrichia shahii TaxID=157691 RepID=UPI0028D90D4E|nr:helix-turn-helix transcriptional regulator [Leptotrichia shahii]
MENVGKRLKNLREKYKFSLEEVARKIKPSVGTISQYENNERKINSESLIKLSNLYNVSPEYILYGTEKDYNDLESNIVSFFKNENINIEEKEELFNKIQNAFFKEKFK